jgi:tetratricopeptide (TPR) repeat protein
MADLKNALKWLDAIDKSHLRDTIRDSVDRLKERRLSEAESKTEIEPLLTESRNSGDPWEYPEVLVHSAIIEYNNRRLPVALEYLKNAVLKYNGHYHRLAVAQWMLGFIQWELMENDNANENWKSAREAFLFMEEWYKKRAIESAFATKVTRAALFEEGFSWLNHHESSHLTRTPRELQTIIAKRLDDMMKNKNKDKAQDTWIIYQLMYKLVDETRGSTDYMETAEAYVECGLAAYKMGHVGDAIRHLEQAIHHYHPGTHQQAVARWLLGIVQWEVEGFEDPARLNLQDSFRDHARHNWQEAINIFEQAALHAQHRNRIAQAKWYSETLHVMQDALGEKIRSFYGLT